MGSEPVYDMLLNRSLALMDRARQHIQDSREKLSEK
jgi:flagellar biosynthesis regulator FlaF